MKEVFCDKFIEHGSYQSGHGEGYPHPHGNVILVSKERVRPCFQQLLGDVGVAIVRGQGHRS